MLSILYLRRQISSKNAFYFLKTHLEYCESNMGSIVTECDILTESIITECAFPENHKLSKAWVLFAEEKERERERRRKRKKEWERKRGRKGEGEERRESIRSFLWANYHFT